MPEILGHDPENGLFAMTYLDPATLSGLEGAAPRRPSSTRASPPRSAAASRAIHAATAGDSTVAARFATDRIFHPIRLEPYLEATRAAASAASPTRLMTLSRETLAGKKALVHGDVSPKNILAGPRGPVFLDAECAWYGDPAFDLAFCLNHLLLKCLWNRPAAAALLGAFDALAAAYLGGVDLGAAGRGRGADGAAPAGPVPRPRRRQVAGRIHHRRMPTGSASGRPRCP